MKKNRNIFFVKNFFKILKIFYQNLRGNTLPKIDKINFPNNTNITLPKKKNINSSFYRWAIFNVSF